MAGTGAVAELHFTSLLQHFYKVAELSHKYPYTTSATVVALLSGWLAYEAYVRGPTHAKKRQLEKRQARVNMDSPLGLGFKTCPETLEKIELVVDGTIPSWLTGKLFRSGPGVLDVPTSKGFTYLVTHWFDGLTVMHGFEIKDGQVFYSNRKAAEEVEQYIAQHGGTNWTFGADPCKTLFQKLSSVFLPAGDLDPRTGRAIINVGVTVKKIQGELYNCTDANKLMRFDPETLQTTGRQEAYGKFNRKIKGQLSTAHGQYDAKRGEYYNVVGDIGVETVYKLFVVPDHGEARVLCEIPEKAAYLHSFGLTENYFIFQLWPTYLNGPKLLWHKSVVSAMEWDGKANSKFYVVDRRSGEIVHMYETSSAFCFHNINAWEEEDGNKIVMDLALYKDNSPINDLVIDRILSADYQFSRSPLVRFTLTNVRNDRPGARNVIKRVIYDNTIELPRINRSRHMQPYTYAYGVSMREGAAGCFFERLVKVNVRTGESMVWDVKDHLPAEPIFLASPDAEDEDDGVLLSIVLNGETGTSYLLILNAKDLSEIARAHVPHHIPFGFHGNFFGDDEGNSSDLM